jgi:hypothetical protein
MVAQRFSAGSNSARSASTLPKALSSNAYRHRSHELRLRHLRLLHRPSGRPSATHLTLAVDFDTENSAAILGAFDFDTDASAAIFASTSALSPGGTSDGSPALQRWVKPRAAPPLCRRRFHRWIPHSCF